MGAGESSRGESASSIGVTGGGAARPVVVEVGPGRAEDTGGTPVPPVASGETPVPAVSSGVSPAAAPGPSRHLTDTQVELALEPGMPTLGEIERAHLASCPLCAARVAASGEDDHFLGRVRELTSDALGPAGAPRLAGYRTTHLISSGAQGVVYRGVQESTQRPVAIKVLLGGEGASLRQRHRAAREAEIAARLRHPSIVTVFESRTLPDGRIAVVMEYVDGVPIDQWSAPGESPTQRQRALLQTFITICGAVHHAHLNAVIHRDLKPDNILVTPTGRPVVLDFGIAKAGEGGGLRTTVTGEFAGTPAYASPEQASGKPDAVDALTDVYSLGVVLYRLICGELPYAVEGSIFEVARTITTVTPVRPRHRVPSLAVDLEAIILRALSKEKARRYQSAADLARDLERFLAGAPVEARSGSGWYVLRKAVVMNKGRLAVAGLALALIAGSVLAVGVSLNNAREAERRAGLERAQARAVTELLRDALPNPDPTRPEVAKAIGEGLGKLYFRLETGAFAGEPELDAALRRLWGEVYTGLGSGKAANLVEYAEVSLRSGLVRQRSLHGAKHPEVAATLHQLAAVLLVRQRYDQARTFAREALVMRGELHGPRSLEAAQTMALLARVQLGDDRLDDADRLAGQALEVYERAGGAEHELAIASMLTVRARVALSKGRAGEAGDLLRRALRLRLGHLPPDDADLIGTLDDCAALSAAAPDHPLSVDLARAWDVSPEGLSARLRADGPRLSLPYAVGELHPRQTGRTPALQHLARYAEGEFGSASPVLIPLYIAIMRSATGEQIVSTRVEAGLRAADLISSAGLGDYPLLVCLEDACLASLYSGDLERALPLSRRIVEIYENVPADVRDRTQAALSRRYLAWFLSLSGRYAEAEPEYRRSAGQFRAALGEDSTLLALAEAELGAVLARQGKIEEGEAISAGAMRVVGENRAIAGDQLAHMMAARGAVLLCRARASTGDERRRLAEDAEACFKRAWKGVYDGVGWRAAFRQVMIHDAAEAMRLQGDEEGAKAWESWLERDPPVDREGFGHG